MEKDLHVKIRNYFRFWWTNYDAVQSVPKLLESHYGIATKQQLRNLQMDIAKSETFKNFIILNKALLFLIKLSKTAVQSVPKYF